MTKVKKKSVSKGRICLRQPGIYAGIDVHKKQWTVCICTEHTNFRSFVIDPDPGTQTIKDHAHRSSLDFDQHRHGDGSKIWPAQKTDARPTGHRQYCQKVTEPGSVCLAS
ncbi:MAG: hypothetical protein ACI9OS_002663 [Ulvibacter sp.]|jgi:hypothetical protein